MTRWGCCWLLSWEYRETYSGMKLKMEDKRAQSTEQTKLLYAYAVGLSSELITSIMGVFYSI